MTSCRLSIDIETYSDVDLKKSGAWKYAESPDFEILLFAYAYDDGPVEIIDFACGDEMDVQVLKDLTDSRIVKTAFNAPFEIACISAYFCMELDPAQWEDTMVQSLMMGLPGNLDGATKAIGASEKDSAGTLLISYFCKPCKPTKSNGGRTRNYPGHAPEKWELFKAYNIQDVEAERDLRNKLSAMPSDNFRNKFERDLWVLDQEINNRGILIDMNFVDAAAECSRVEVERLMNEASALTGLNNPNSDVQLKDWMQEKGYPVDSLGKDSVKELLRVVRDPDVRKVLELRAQFKRSSIKKYLAMKAVAGDDNRARGTFAYYGANRTGRWAGQKIQLQNMRKNELPDLDLARTIVKEKRYDELQLLFGDTQDTISQLIRTSFIPKDGHTFIVSDFSAIEARVIAWLANETWRLDVFKTHGKIYEASAAQMFKVDIDTIDKGSPLRAKGKIAELALGYGGSIGALKAMGALDMGVEEDELQGLVDAWRAANPRIVKLWWDVGNKVVDAIDMGGTHYVNIGSYIGEGYDSETGETFNNHAKRITIRVKKGMLLITLPSGRDLCYYKPRLTENRFGSLSPAYWGVNQETKQWGLIETYGPKLVENITQAIARDCLATAIMRLAQQGYNTVAHVHDEVILEVPKDKANIEKINNIMSVPLKWAPGLNLDADGYQTDYYRKD